MDVLLIFAITSLTYFLGTNYNEETASSLSEVLICFISIYSTLYSLYAFLIYLFLDTFFRSSLLDNEMVFHHTCAFILTLLGVIGVLYSDESIVASKVANLFIRMEVTSPFIHLVKYHKKRNEIIQTAICSICILLLWIPYRIINPFLALSLLFTIYNTNIIYVPIIICGILLFLMQIYWYIRLCVLASKQFCKFVE